MFLLACNYFDPKAYSMWYFPSQFFFSILDFKMMQVDVLHVSTGCVQVLQPPSLYLPKTGGWRPADHDAFLRLLLGRFRGRPTGEFLSEACLQFLETYKPCCSIVVEIPV